MPIVVVLLAAVVVGGFTGAVVARFPALDPAAPHVAPQTIARATRRPTTAGFVRSRLDPEVTAGLLLTTALGFVLGATAAIGALFVMAEHNALLAHYDLSAARWGAAHATVTSTRFLRDVSLLGGTPVMIAMAIGVAVGEYARTRLRTVFWFVLAVVLGQSVLMNFTKWIVDRPRPDIARLTGFSGSSFPSGHATAAAATFAVAAFLVGRGRSHRVKVVVATSAASIAAAVATSRVLLGVHWFTDVLAGLALGWGWFALCSIAFGGRVLRWGLPVEVAEVEAETARSGPTSVGRVERGL